jgi:hypothetical protein
VALAGITAALALPAARASDDAGAGVALVCETVPAPGRVRCSVDARVGPDEKITWGDVVLVAAPPFVSPLRARIGPHDATVRDAGAWQWAFALVAKSAGRGLVEGRVRLVVCRGDRCQPREVPVSGSIAVGP